jgi:hypothetical protein
LENNTKVIYRKFAHLNACLEHVSAARILESIDRDSDPCEDFYQFACGGWISQHPVPESQSTWDQFRALREQLLVQLRGAWQQYCYSSIETIKIVYISALTLKATTLMY